mmetsp:Transcript_26113/g.65824  ORF Transcript_26113/g.65824 Transcript_26113/m.65824 type:complete len:286 (-) Transcript_26113:887-1744(-)
MGDPSPSAYAMSTHLQPPAPFIRLALQHFDPGVRTTHHRHPENSVDRHHLLHSHRRVCAGGNSIHHAGNGFARRRGLARASVCDVEGAVVVPGEPARGGEVLRNRHRLLPAPLHVIRLRDFQHRRTRSEKNGVVVDGDASHLRVERVGDLGQLRYGLRTARTGANHLRGVVRHIRLPPVNLLAVCHDSRRRALSGHELYDLCLRHRRRRPLTGCVCTGAEATFQRRVVRRDLRLRLQVLRLDHACVQIPQSVRAHLVHDAPRPTSPGRCPRSAIYILAYNLLTFG